MHVRIGFRTSPQNVDWPTLETAWAEAGQHDIFDSGWMNDHLTDPGRERGGPSFEALTALAALARLVPGKDVGHTVLAATFRHPALVAKAALTLDHVTGGHFILGLGAGWHEREHADFGIELPAIGERMDRFEAQVRVLRALFSRAASGRPGVTLDAPPYRLDGATMEPSPIRDGGPPIWLGGQRARGLRLAARHADGWDYPANVEGTVEEFTARRDRLLRACEEVGRDPAEIAVSVQMAVGEDAAARGAAVGTATAYARAGATEIILSIAARTGSAGIRALAAEVAVPLRETLG